MRSAWWTTFGDYTWKVGLGICFGVRKSICQMACFISQSFPTSSDTRASFVNFLNLDNPFQKLFGAIINSWKFFPWTPQNDWHPILCSKHQQRRRLFHLAFARYSAYKGRKTVLPSDRPLDYAPCCTASKLNLYPQNSALPDPWLGY